MDHLKHITNSTNTKQNWATAGADPAETCGGLIIPLCNVEPCMAQGRSKSIKGTMDQPHTSTMIHRHPDHHKPIVGTGMGQAYDPDG